MLRRISDVAAKRGDMADALAQRFNKHARVFGASCNLCRSILYQVSEVATRKGIP